MADRPPRAVARVMRLGCALAMASALLTACSLTRPHPNVDAMGELAPAWEAPAAPSGDVPGAAAQSLAQWWAGWHDDDLNAMLASAQQRNYTLAQAAARIAQARADAAAAGAALWPSLDLNGSAISSRNPLQQPPGKLTYSTASLDARWELDLFGAARAGREAGLAALQARENEWHDARTSLAAEVANTYVGLRVCEAQQRVLEKMLVSQNLSQDLYRQKAEAGFISPVELAQNSALLAKAHTQLQQQKTECAVLIKSLAVLTVTPEAALRDTLGAHSGQVPEPAAFAIDSVPAQVLVQRPDLRAALQHLSAVAAEIGVAQAQRFPSLSLTGSIGSYGLRYGGQTMSGSTWSFGPVLNLPLFDAGRRKAEVENAEARYQEALAGFKQQTLLAVKEVEEALVRLDGANRNLAQQQKIDEARALALQAADSSLKAGTLGVPEREEVWRQHLLGQEAQLQLQRERASAWIALYKAVGGDWQKPIAEQATEQATPAAQAAAK